MNFPVIYTQRLLLRKLVEEDEQAIFILRSDKRVNAWLDRAPAMSLEESRAFINKVNLGVNHGKSYYWAISTRDHPLLIGTICIWNITEDRKLAEIGYELHPDWQGRGLMKEAVAGVIEFCFSNTTIDTLLAFTHRENIGSLRVLEHNLFKIDDSQTDPENEDHLIYRLDKSKSNMNG